MFKEINTEVLSHAYFFTIIAQQRLSSHHFETHNIITAASLSHLYDEVTTPKHTRQLAHVL